MSTGLLWLEGPLQAWGHDSLFGRRTTLPFPTRSGVLGLLCCALGRGGEQRQWLEAMRPYRQTVVAYARANAQIPPLLRDFHMVGSGYDPKDSWKSMMTPKTSEGKPPVGNGARLTYRHYLQDWAFACALELPEGDDIGAALSNPVWPVYLGRKCCPPADYIWRGSFAGIEEALARAEEIAEEKGRKRIFRVNAGATEGDEVMTLNDVPIAFGPYKEYTSRQVTLVRGEAIL